MLKWTSGGSLDIAQCSRDSDIIKVKDVCSSTFHTVDQRASSSLTKTPNIMESNLSRRDDCTPKQDKTDFKQIRRIDKDVNLITRDRSIPPSPQDVDVGEVQDVNVNLRKSGLFTKFKNIFKRSSSKGPGTKSAPNSPTAFGSIHRIDGNQSGDLVDGRTPSSSLKGRKSRLERLIDANRDNRRHKERLHETQTKVNTPLSESSGNDQCRSNFVSQANNKQLSPWHNDIPNINAFHSKIELMRDQQNERHKTVTSRHIAQFVKQSAILENRAQDIRENKRKRFTTNSTSTKSDTCILPSMLEGIVSKASYTKESASLNHKNCNRFNETTDNRTDLSPLKMDNALLRSAVVGRSPKSDSIYFRNWLEKVKQIDPFTLHTAKRSLNKLNISDRKFTWSCSKDGRLIVSPSPKQKRSKNILPQRDRSCCDKIMPRNNNNGHGPLHGRKDIDILAVGSSQSLALSTVDKFKEQPPTRTSYPKNEILLSCSLTQKIYHNQDTDDSSRVRRIVHSLEEKMSSGTFHFQPTILPVNNSSKPPKSPSKKDIAVAECKLISKNEQPNNSKESRSPEQSISSKDDSNLRSQMSEFSHSRGFETKLSLPVNNTNDVSDVSISTAEDESVHNNSDDNGEINSKMFDTKEQILSLTYTDKSLTQLDSESPSSVTILSHTPNQNIEATLDSFESFSYVELHRNEPLVADEPSFWSSESLYESSLHLLESFTEKSETPVYSQCKNNDNEMLLQNNELTLSTSDLQNEDHARNITGQSSTAVHNDLNQESKIKNNETTDEETIRKTSEISSFLKIPTEISQNALNDPEDLSNFETKGQTISVVDSPHECLEEITCAFDENTQRKASNEGISIEYMTNVDLENVNNLHSGSRTSVTHTLLQTEAYSNQLGDLHSNDEHNDSGYRDKRNRMIDCHVNQKTDCQGKGNKMTNCQGNQMTDCQGNQMIDCEGNKNTDNKGYQMMDYHGNKNTECQDNQMTSSQGNQTIDYPGNQTITYQRGENIDCQITEICLKQDGAILIDSDTFVNDIFQDIPELDKHLKQTEINEQIADISAPECTSLRNCEVTADEFPNSNSPEIIDALPPSHLSTSSVDKAIIGLSFSSSDISLYKEDQFTDISLSASDSLCNMSFFSKKYDTELCALHTPTSSQAQISTHIFKTGNESFVGNAKNGQGLELLTPKCHTGAYGNLASEINGPNIDSDDRFVLDEHGIMDIRQKIGKVTCEEQELSGTKEYTKQNVNVYTDVTNEEDAEFHAINNDELSSCSESVKNNESTGNILKLATSTQLGYAIEHQFDEEEFLPQSSLEKCKSFSAMTVNVSDLEVHGNGHKKKSDSRSKSESLEQYSTSVRSCFTSRVNAPASKRKAFGVGTSTNNVDLKDNYSIHSIEKKHTADEDSMILYNGQESDLHRASNDYKPIRENVSPWTCESSCTMPDEKIHFHEGSSIDDANVTPVKLYNDSIDLAPFLVTDDYQSSSNKSTFGGDAWEKTTLTDFSASFTSDVSGDGSGDCFEPCEITKMNNMSEKFLQTFQQPAYTKNESPVTESSHLSLVATNKERQFLKLRRQRQTGHKSVKKTKSMTSRFARMNFKKSINNGDECKPFNHIDFCYIGGHQSGKTCSMLSEDETKEVTDHKLYEVNDKLKNEYDQDKEIGESLTGEYNKPKQWFFLATMLFFQLLIHWLYAR